MSEDRVSGERNRGGMPLETIDGDDSAGGIATPGEPDRPPWVRVRTLERVAIVRFTGTEFLYEEPQLRAVGDRLNRLVREEGHTRLVLNFGGVRLLSSDVLALLVELQKELVAAGGQLQLCRLDPVLREVLRISRLDRVFDVCGDEAEALGLILL